ncbi:hypothetical protein EPN15_03130 [Patescibacteria group bacterium]|nr:MAG: hypothetical protein EPN15_03130 [Patescibacteria group bacterium]
MKKIIALSSLALALAPLSALAIVEYEIEILETIEMPLELLNMVIALAAVTVSLFLIKSFAGGTFAAAARFLAAASFAFAFVEIFGVLKGLEIFKIGGLIDVVEFIFVALFLTALLKLLKSVRG